MQIGDKVEVKGTLVDMKEGSCLVRCDDDREYWFLEKNVSEQPATEAPAATHAAAASATHTATSSGHEPHHEAEPPAHEPPKAPAKK